MRKKNKELRGREYLLPEEIIAVVNAASETEEPVRNKCMILMAYKHGLRLHELLGLRWNQIDLHLNTISVERLKNGTPSIQPLSEEEVTLLKQLKTGTDKVFNMHSRSFQRLLKKLGEKAGLSLSIHPHMLRHSVGHRLINQGVDVRTVQGFLGHRNLNMTVLYTYLDRQRYVEASKLL